MKIVTLIIGLLTTVTSLSSFAQSGNDFSGTALAAPHQTVLGHGIDLRLPVAENDHLATPSTLKAGATTLRLQLGKQRRLNITLDVSGLSLSANF
ncbi:hypothetical protein HCU74_05655 [Spongiibacter sp. KMU-166]|uniref:M1 family peptidase n=1 Tax=Spongiibacter thalassae TaxID=2721624 RepID=A0ABX1GCP2_9GAMM|nr:hypothetical protein [Spongiibacter thalassae]NKI16903.1 hypothetical protein [Spongiibacter thalassae]